MNNKYLLAFSVLFVGFVLVTATPIRAQMGSMMGLGGEASESSETEGAHGESITVVLGEILDKQQASTVQELDCDKISDDELERLGDAVMESQHPGVAHEAMDRMMGGEGSETLKKMHISMGNNYLGCDGSSGLRMMGSSTMSSGMMGGLFSTNKYHSGSMMGFGGTCSSWHKILAGLTWLAVMTFFISGTYFFIKKSRKK